MEGWAFSQCTACSAVVVDAYRAGGWEFVRRAIGDYCAPAAEGAAPTPSSSASPHSFLEELTGLAELHRAAERSMAEDDDGGDGDDDNGDVGGNEEREGGSGEGGSGEGEARGGGKVRGGDGNEDDDWTEL